MSLKKITFYYSLISLVLILINTGCTGSGSSPEIKKTSSVGYNLKQPDKTIILPGSLREISGIALIDTSTVACIEDEKGIVYLYDIEKDETRKLIYFGPRGDYEGITIAGNTIYVLRSDGVLFIVPDYTRSSFAEELKLTGIDAENNEGLCYDQNDNILLITPKEKSLTGPGYRKNHPVYSFDIDSKTFNSKPLIKIKISDVAEFLVDHGIIKFNKIKKKEKNEPEYIFKPSDIAIHPITNKLYMLCSREKMFFVFDMNGNIEYAEKLDPEIFSGPEGITFLPNGDMLISNEAGNKYPSILRFNYRPK